MDALSWRDLLTETTRAVGRAVGSLDADDRRRPGGHRGQYHLDLVADRAVLAALADSGAAVLSEEAGLVEGIGGGAGGLTVVVDPVDGSTNFAHGIPHAACSLCVVDDAGPWVSIVADLATGERFDAIRGAGARLDGEALSGPSGCTELGAAIVGVAGWPGALPCAQFRSLGAASLDLCYVAAGRLDAYTDAGCRHGVWDYLGALLVLSESGAVVGERAGRELVVLEHAARRGPMAAATRELLDELGEALPTVAS